MNTADESLALSPPPAVVGSLRVLVIEDDRDTAETLRVLLDCLGHEVSVAFTGPQGVQVARAWRPDAVVCDIGLPGLDGWGVASALRRQPSTAAARLIAVTAYGGDADRQRSREAGFDFHLTKPCDPWLLGRLIRIGWQHVDLRSDAEAAGLLDAVAAAVAAADYPDKDAFAVRLALHEALANAFKHGNRGDPAKGVRVRYHVGCDSVEIEVEDEGAGFDPSAVPDPRAPENLERPGGRGIHLMRTYMTDCIFNEKGNRVTLRKARSVE
jgi:CheY-like chemotaxis protein